MALLASGLETIEIGSVTWREIMNGNLAKLDRRTTLSGTLAARPAPGASPRFYYATDSGELFYDAGPAWELIARRPVPTFITVSFSGVVQTATIGNFKLWQRRLYFPAGARVAGAQVIGCDSLDPGKTAADLTIIRISDGDWQQNGTPQGFDLTLPGDQADARIAPAAPLVIPAAAYVYVFVLQASGGHGGPQLLLEFL